MDKQARLAAIHAAIKETSDKKDAAVYGARMNIDSREWHFAKNCIDRIIACELQIEDLNIEANSLLKSIEDEKREVIL